MAVAQGYGKTVTSGSVFAYDTGDTVNSYRGEPTTNVVTNSQPTSGWNTANAQGSTITRSFLIENGIPFIRLSDVINGADYPRVTDSVFANSATITGTFSTSLEVRGTPGAQLRLRIYENGSTKITNTITLTSEWIRYKFENQSTTFSLNQPYFNPATTGATYDIRNIQIEAKPYSTPFVNGTRSSTQGLLTLVGNNTIDLSNVSFDSNAQMVFDGTNDYTVIGTVGITDYSQPFTMECIFKVDSAATWDNGFLSNIYGIAGSYAGMYGLFKNSNNAVGLQLRDATTTSYATATGLSKGSYYHLVGTWNGSNTMVLYVNGVVTQTTSTTKTGATDSSNLYIGGVRAYGGAAGNYYQGEIPIVKYYNRALTAAEINQNYLHYKTRFNLS